MKKLNLYLDFEFTSLSPDAQPISMGIVSDERDFRTGIHTADLRLTTKQFYAEFADFDISRCDDWVKENVVEKLKHYKQINAGGFKRGINSFEFECNYNTNQVKKELLSFLEQFYDYQIQIVVDCGTWDWYHFLQLVAEWEVKKIYLADMMFGTKHASNELKRYGYTDVVLTDMQGADTSDLELYKSCSYGLPKLPSNISPVPQDLNDIIAIKKGISPKEAFYLNREVVAFGRPDLAEHEKHNALWDAKVIKAIYQKLMQ